MIARVKRFFSPHRITLSARMTILDCYTSKAENLSLTLYAANHADKNVIPPKRQARKERPYLFLQTSATFAPLRETRFSTSSSSPKVQISLALPILDFRSENLESVPVYSPSPQSSITQN